MLGLIGDFLWVAVFGFCFLFAGYWCSRILLGCCLVGGGVSKVLVKYLGVGLIC